MFIWPTFSLLLLCIAKYGGPRVGALSGTSVGSPSWVRRRCRLLRLVNTSWSRTADVEASSDGPNRGATFTLWRLVRAVIPRAATPAELQRSESPPSVPASLAGIRVLVIDDEADAREPIHTVLSELGAVVETAADGFAACKRLAHDVIVSDIGMPDEDGFSFIRRIRALPPSEGARVPRWRSPRSRASKTAPGRPTPATPRTSASR